MCIRDSNRYQQKFLDTEKPLDTSTVQNPSDSQEILKPTENNTEQQEDLELSLIHIWLTSEKKIETAIGIVANENKYHPIRDFLNSLAWDGTERIRFLSLIHI